jgi:2-hydroxy-3-keto-5-methylthiopentenyl-1-phosphate phosphatase
MPYSTPKRIAVTCPHTLPFEFKRTQVIPASEERYEKIFFCGDSAKPSVMQTKPDINIAHSILVKYVTNFLNIAM